MTYQFSANYCYFSFQISILLCLTSNDQQMCAKSEYAASRIVNINVAINPFLYAIMKPSYRRGYWSLLKKLLRCLSFGQLNSAFTGMQLMQPLTHFYVPLWNLAGPLQSEYEFTHFYVQLWNLAGPLQSKLAHFYVPLWNLAGPLQSEFTGTQS